MDVNTRLAREEETRVVTAAVVAAIRVALDSIGHRLASCRDGANAELERLGAFLSLPAVADLSQKEVAQRVGVSRQTLLNLRRTGRGAEHEWPIDLLVMLELGLHGPENVDDLSKALAHASADRVELDSILRRLMDQSFVRDAGSLLSGSDRTPLFRLTGDGVQQLPAFLLRGAMPPSRRWIAYVTSTVEEVDAIVAAGGPAGETRLAPSAITIMGSLPACVRAPNR